jgi:hypothetical protein
VGHEPNARCNNKRDPRRRNHRDGLGAAAPAAAHHGGGTLDNPKTIELAGTLTRLELINPHSWIHFDAVGPDGKLYATTRRTAGTVRSRRAGVYRGASAPRVGAIALSLVVRLD